MININGKEWNELKLKDIETFLSELEDDETFFLEFKEEEIRQTQITKELSAFANSYGGYLFLGVEDKTKKIVGCTDKWSELRINTTICNGISPTPQFDIKTFKLKNSKKLYVIKVEEGFFPPYITNEGYIYHRVSSSSDRVKDSNTLNNLYEKKKDNIKKTEQKIYIPDISGQLPDNFCGYIDLGFSLITRDLERTKEVVRHADLNKISDILKENGEPYSISKVGFSISITVGTRSISRGGNSILPNAGLSNFMEILPDGSFRCRVIIVAEKNSSIASTSHVTLIQTLYSKIYESIFGEDFSKCFIQADRYEKLIVIKQFQPKIMVKNGDVYESIVNEYFNNHLIKYGNNIIVNSNRVPFTGFLTLDKNIFELNGIEFTTKNIYEQLFYTSYLTMGYIDRFPSLPDE